MMPKPPRIAARHAGDMRHVHDLRREMAGDAIGLKIMRIDDVKGSLRMNARRGAGELGHEGACHWDVGLRPVDGIGPVHRHGACAVARLTARPVIGPHVHPEGRCDLLGIGDDMHLMAERSEAMGVPIGAHADAALDRRIFADDADSHRGTSSSPWSASSDMSASSSAIAPNPARSVQVSSSTSKAYTGAGTSKIAGSLERGGMRIASIRSRRSTVSLTLPSKMGRMS